MRSGLSGGSGDFYSELFASSRLVLPPSEAGWQEGPKWSFLNNDWCAVVQVCGGVVVSGCFQGLTSHPEMPLLDAKPWWSCSTYSVKKGQRTVGVLQGWPQTAQVEPSSCAAQSTHWAEVPWLDLFACLWFISADPYLDLFPSHVSNNFSWR